MSGPYWMAETDQTPADAVLVCVIEENPEPGGEESGMVLARVQWVMIDPDEDLLISRSEGPFEMGIALDYAEEIAGLYGFARVVVAISDHARWQGEWGTLSPGPSGPH